MELITTNFDLSTYLSIFTSMYNYEYSEDLDNLIEYLIQHKNECHIMRRNEYNVYILLHDKIYEIWISNKWYGYFAEVYVYELYMDSKSEGTVKTELYSMYIEYRASRNAVYNFFKTFDNNNVQYNFQAHRNVQRIYDLIENECKITYPDYNLKRILFHFHYWKGWELVKTNNEEETKKLDTHEDVSNSQGDL